MDFNKIKLIIFDLDETFWKGTLSEGNVAISPDNIELIGNLVDCGVMCSICSKNDEEMVRAILVEKQIWEYFVFSSIDWTAKGPRIKRMIDDMHLRYSNVLFIDDNSSNRGEVEHFCPEIMTADPIILPEICTYYRNQTKADIAHKRLEQYRILEKKNKKAKESVDVYDFLRSSHIQVEIGYDCITHLDRIEDLVKRSNQLNFTKVRSSKAELLELVSDKRYNCGYVNVKDDFGDYGLVGFFAIFNGRAVHFVFSCRTLGMGIEQYVYALLCKPEIDIVGEVVSELHNPVVTWINEKSEGTNNAVKSKVDCKIVVHGPCDVSSMFGFIHESPNIVKEFNYVNDKGISIEQRNCTTHIVEFLKFDQSIRKSLSLKKLPFYDDEMFDTAIFDDDIEFVVLSLFTDPCLACYREKETGLVVCFGDSVYDLTDLSRTSEFVSGKQRLHNCEFTIEDLEYIHQNFEYMGRIQPEEIVDNIDYIYNHLNPNCKLILTLQSETPFTQTSSIYAYGGPRPAKLDQKKRHIYNKELNDCVRKWSVGKEKVLFLDFNKYITGQESFADHISHFKREVYYKMSCDLVALIRENGTVRLENQSRFEVKVSNVKMTMSRIVRGINRRIKRLFNRNKS